MSHLRGVIALRKDNIKLAPIGMHSPDGVTVDAKKGAMMNECLNVQLHLCYRIGIIARTKLLVSVLLRVSCVTTPSRGHRVNVSKEGL